MQNQINGFISVFFIILTLFGYRKGYNTQQALLAHIEKWKNILDDKGFGGAVHCVKSVLIWSFSGPDFPAFGLNMK